MVDARLDAFLYGSEDGCCQVVGIGRGAYLVEDDAQLVLLVPEPDHGLHEVVAEG